MEKSNGARGTAYSTSEFLCSLCSRVLTESCYNCGADLYWRSFEPDKESIENPPDFPGARKWHSAGYGEKLNILGFYMRALLAERRAADGYHSRDNVHR